jgi:hypothetical protein
MEPRTPLLILSFAVAACAQSEPDLVRARAASQFHCDSPMVTVNKLRAVDPEVTLYTASACGHDVVYRCTQSAIDDVVSRGTPRTPRPTTVCTVDSQSSNATRAWDILSN